MKYDPTEYRKLGQASFQGRPVLKEHMERKQEVVFDPADHLHRQMAKEMFIRVDAEAKEALPVKFKLEPPFTSVKAMVFHRITYWALTKEEV